MGPPGRACAQVVLSAVPRRSPAFIHAPLRVSALLLACLSSACAGGAKSSAPPRADVCEHLVELVQTQSRGEADAQLVEQVGSDCEASLEAIEGRYAQLSTCLIAAETFEDVGDCERPAASYEPLLRSLLSPRQALCVHIGELVAEASGGRDEVDMAACMAEFDGIEAQFGPERSAEVEQCMGAARTVEDFGMCESMLGGGPAGAAAGGDAERATCEHVMDVLEAELAGMGESPDPNARAEALGACMEGLAMERERLGEARFGQLVACTQSAVSMDEVMRCNDSVR